MSERCSEAIARVYEYIDGEITWWRRQRIRWHLRKCSPCDGAFRFEHRLKSLIRERSAEPAPPELLERLRTFLRENGVEGI